MVPPLALVCAWAMACGCNARPRRSGPVSAGEIAVAEGRLKVEQGNMMLKGERMVVEGRARRARGDALVEQGRRVKGARESRRGELLIRYGEATIDVAEEMETEVGPSTRASGDR